MLRSSTTSNHSSSPHKRKLAIWKWWLFQPLLLGIPIITAYAIIRQLCSICDFQLINRGLLFNGQILSKCLASLSKWRAVYTGCIMPKYIPHFPMEINNSDAWKIGIKSECGFFLHSVPKPAVGNGGNVRYVFECCCVMPVIKLSFMEMISFIGALMTPLGEIRWMYKKVTCAINSIRLI